MLMLKICACCGAEYDQDGWNALTMIGFQKDAVETLEMRNCTCGNTLAVTVRENKKQQQEGTPTRLRSPRTVPRSYDPAWAASVLGVLLEAVGLAPADDGSVDIDDLGELARLGDKAHELLDELDRKDDCGCSDPGCPCDGIKRGVP